MIIITYIIILNVFDWTTALSFYLVLRGWIFQIFAISQILLVQTFCLSPHTLKQVEATWFSAQVYLIFQGRVLNEGMRAEDV